MPEQDRALVDQMLVETFGRLRAKALALSVGIVGGAGLFAATVGLLVKASLAGDAAGPTGPHLALLANYFPGYTVTWTGAFVGLGYGFAAGFVLGLLVAALLNLNHFAYLRIVRRRIDRAAIFDGL